MNFLWSQKFALVITIHSKCVLVSALKRLFRVIYWVCFMRDYTTSLLALMNILFKLVTFSKERRRVQIIPIAQKTQRAQPLVTAKTDMKMTLPTAT